MSISPYRNPKQNRLIAALPDNDYGRLLPDLEFIAMPLGWRVFDAAAPISYVYFPTTSIVSMLHAMDGGSGEPAEITFAGSDCLVGLSAFMDNEKSLRRGVVHIAGDGYRVKADILKAEFALGGKFHQLAQRFAESVRARLLVIAACRRQHVAMQQLCRWLLQCSDALASTELKMTPELIANVLHREDMAQAVATLERAGMVRYARSQITILDRMLLLQKSCQCYGAIKSEVEAMMAHRNAFTRAPVPGAHDD